MKIQEALKKRKGKQTITSESISMYQQCPKSLFYWVIEDDETGLDHKIGQLVDILRADDWVVDKPLRKFKKVRIK